MDSDNLSEDTGIHLDFLARHTTDPTLLPSPQNSEHLSGVTDIHLPRIEREEQERREIIERWEREQRGREVRERELRGRRERQERQTRERLAREIREQERTEHNNEEQRVRQIYDERTPIHDGFNGQCHHYKRLCNVSFTCCGFFFPCHICHNESDTCEIDNVKGKEATRVKCTSCGHEEEVSGMTEFASLRDTL